MSSLIAHIGVAIARQNHGHGNDEGIFPNTFPFPFVSPSRLKPWLLWPPTTHAKMFPYGVPGQFWSDPAKESGNFAYRNFVATASGKTHFHSLVPCKDKSIFVGATFEEESLRRLHPLDGWADGLEKIYKIE
jgi:hypothetical protein